MIRTKKESQFVFVFLCLLQRTINQGKLTKMKCLKFQKFKKLPVFSEKQLILTNRTKNQCLHIHVWTWNQFEKSSVSISVFFLFSIDVPLIRQMTVLKWSLISDHQTIVRPRHPLGRRLSSQIDYSIDRALSFRSNFIDSDRFEARSWMNFGSATSFSKSAHQSHCSLRFKFEHVILIITVRLPPIRLLFLYSLI